MPRGRIMGMAISTVVSTKATGLPQFGDARQHPELREKFQVSSKVRRSPKWLFRLLEKAVILPNADLTAHGSS
jgi:hypothetical protein